jgi:hypothetical protein
MVASRTLLRGAVVVLFLAAPAVWYACSDRGLDNPAAPTITPPISLRPIS